MPPLLPPTHTAGRRPCRRHHRHHAAATAHAAGAAATHSAAAAAHAADEHDPGIAGAGGGEGGGVYPAAAGGRTARAIGAAAKSAATASSLCMAPLPHLKLIFSITALCTGSHDQGVTGAASHGRAKMSQNWAICIGIDRYDNLQSLHFAKRDAEALRDFFEKEVAFEKVYFFAEDAPPIPTDFGEPIRSTPTGGTLRRFLRIRFEQKFLKPSDNFWFFFAGHGRRERDRDYLMPSDADPGNVEETAIPVSLVTERLRRCGAENVILLLDACRNEGARDGEGVGAEAQPGVVSISSCSPNERSYEIDELQHGAFTYSLLEGLRLEGENNCATVERLDQHLRFRVPELCQHYKKPRQTPYTQAEPIEKRHLILLPKHAALSPTSTRSGSTRCRRRPQAISKPPTSCGGG